MPDDLTQEELKRVLHYDPETGVFRWLVQLSSRGLVGTVAGCLAKPNYITYRGIGIHGRRYWAHRLAWLYVTGAWPTRLIDHEDRDGTNNRFKNLRLATDGENKQNQLARRDNKLGSKGVLFDERRACYQAYLQVGGKQYQRRFPTLEEAVAFREEMEKLHHPFRPGKGP